ncbi:MAG: methylated-DNA--[protein]-cysteine S-methyltransferase [Pirellulales bacterium]|nr:methylated-DNA--[protein]-cysteine S-methyltransferase [Pirellulales bacterium]
MATNTSANQAIEIVSAPSELGYIAVAVRNGRLCGVSFGEATAAAAERRVRRCAEEIAFARGVSHHGADDADPAKIVGRLVRYASGVQVPLDDLPLGLAPMTGFQRRVVAACRAIPYGQTRTYGQLAASAGSPGAARAAGQVMASNRIPLVIPCHRVVAANGRLGGFSAPQGTAMKRRLLALEAAAVSSGAAKLGAADRRRKG